MKGRKSSTDGRRMSTRKNYSPKDGPWPPQCIMCDSLDVVVQQVPPSEPGHFVLFCNDCGHTTNISDDQLTAREREVTLPSGAFPVRAVDGNCWEVELPDTVKKCQCEDDARNLALLPLVHWQCQTNGAQAEQVEAVAKTYDDYGVNCPAVRRLKTWLKDRDEAA